MPHTPWHAPSQRTPPFWWGRSISTAQANYNGDSTYGGGSQGEYRQRTVRVNSFEPNPWGLYNVHGNVWDWTEDRWHDNYQGAPSAWTTACSYSNAQVLRGGSWLNYANDSRSTSRIWNSNDVRSLYLGFRVARMLAP